jgi:hypothetical protein
MCSNHLVRKASAAANCQPGYKIRGTFTGSDRQVQPQNDTEVSGFLPVHTHDEI